MSDEKQTKDKAAGKGLYPVLPLRDIVVFPYMIVPLFVGREKSINALEEVMRSDKHILLAAQKNAGDDDPATDAIYPDRHARLRAAAPEAARRHREGAGRGHRARASIARYTENPDYFEAEVERVPEEPGAKDEIEALARSAVTQFESYVKLNKKISPEVLGNVAPDRGLLEARRHDRLAPRDQDRRQAGDPRDRDDLRAARARLHADGERDLGAAGRAQDPLARQAPDGEDAARVLS